MAKQLELNLNLSGIIKIVEGAVVVEEEIRTLVRITFGQFHLTAVGDVMFNLPDDKAVAVQVFYVDAHNHPAVVDGAVTWSSSDETIATVTVDPADSTKARVAAGAGLGQVQITAKADADLGAGIRELLTMLDVTVVAGEAVSGVIQPTSDPVPA